MPGTHRPTELREEELRVKVDARELALDAGKPLPNYCGAGGTGGTFTGNSDYWRERREEIERNESMKHLQHLVVNRIECRAQMGSAVEHAIEEGMALAIERGEPVVVNHNGTLFAISPREWREQIYKTAIKAEQT